MKFKTLALTFVLALGALFAISQLNAQPANSKIVFVDAARALASHPSGRAVTDIQARQEQESAPIVEQIQALQLKMQQGQQLTPTEEENADILIRTLRTVQQRYAEEILQASEPAVLSVNSSIASIAESNGYTMVLDGNIAGQSGLGLVVYAQEGLDITDQVIAMVQTGN